MLSFKDIQVQYEDEHPILKGVSGNLNPGDVLGIVGASGGGKSSLLGVLGGFLDPSSGNAFFKEKKIKGPSEQLIPGHPDIQLVNQNFALDLYHTVRENVLVKMAYLPKDLKENFANELLDLVELTSLSDKKAIYLSGGEQQRLAIARALAVEPDVILLDEPFSHLDAHLRFKIGDYLRELVKVRSIACILVSHDGMEIMQWCNRIIFMQDGEFKRIATPKEFYFQPSDWNEGVFFGELNTLKIGDEQVLFRPNEYRLVEQVGISLKKEQEFFCGTFTKYKYLTTEKEHIILYSETSLAHEINIEIVHKN